MSQDSEKDTVAAHGAPAHGDSKHTHGRRTEAALQQSEERFAKAFQSNPAPMCITRIKDGRFIEVNERYCRLFSFAREELIGKTSLELCLWADPATRAIVVDQVQTHGFVREYEAQFRRRNGDLIEAQISMERIDFPDELEPVIVSMFSDVTDRNRAEAAIRQAESKFRGIFENAVEGILQTTPDGRILTANPAFAIMLGYESAEALLAASLSLSRDIYVNPQDRAVYLRETEARGFCNNYHCQFKRKDGQVIWVSLNARPVRDADRNTQYYDATCVNITERKSLEQQIRQSQKMDAIGQLAGGIAHDFNNLLTIINGHSQLILDRSTLDSKTRADLELIFRTGERAAELTRHLLTFSRKQVLSTRIMNLNSVAAEMEKLLRRLIGEDILLSTHFDPALASVKADPNQIEQVIMNLAVNARDAMPDGGSLIIETSNVELCEEYCGARADVKPGPYVLLAVSDTGCGMESSVKARIFEPFFTTKEKGKGTGLGLSTVYGIVKQSEGHIEVYSEPGNGTTFKIYLPQSHDSITPDVRHSRAVSLRGDETILVAEDEEGIRTLIRGILEMNGYTVMISATGKDALQTAERYPDQIHLLVTDVLMPGMNGTELAAKLHRTRAGLRVLYISGYTANVVKRGALDISADFLQKPFTPSALTRKIREILDRAS